MMLVVQKRAGCDVWQLECLASNVTASVQSKQHLHVHTLPVISPLISHIVHNALPNSDVSTSRFRNSPHIAAGYSICTLLHHAPDVLYNITDE